VTVNSELPLADVRILAFTQLGAGPYGMIFLGDLGAEVIKVEDPTTRGDEARSVPPFNDPSATVALWTRVDFESISHWRIVRWAVWFEIIFWTAQMSLLPLPEACAVGTSHRRAAEDRRDSRSCFK